jgi:hypothetical protein
MSLFEPSLPCPGEEKEVGEKATVRVFPERESGESALARTKLTV